MLKVRIKEGTKRGIFIPVPYTLLYLGASIITSRLCWFILNKTTNGTLPPQLLKSRKHLKQLLKQIIQELHRNRGETLVDIRSKDGEEILIKL